MIVEKVRMQMCCEHKPTLDGYLLDCNHQAVYFANGKYWCKKCLTTFLLQNAEQPDGSFRPIPKSYYPMRSHYGVTR